MLKETLIFTAGAGLGVLGSALFFKKKFEKKYIEKEDQLDKEYSDLKAELMLKKDYASESLEKSQGDISEETSERPNTDYTKFWKQPENVQDVIKRAEDKLAEEEGPMEDDTKKPKLIK